MWYRVFGRGSDAPILSDCLAALESEGLRIQTDSRGDDLGWTTVSFRLPGKGGPVVVDRYLAEADDIRSELHSWAAWLETADYCPEHVRLMEHVFHTRQLFALRRPIDHPDEVTLDRLCLAICVFLAEKTDGIYQIDGQGFFDASGVQLLQEY